MGDEADKTHMVPPHEVNQADPPDEAARLRIGVLITDITSITKQPNLKANKITPQFMTTATREEINTKKSTQIQHILSFVHYEDNRNKEGTNGFAYRKFG